MKNRQMVSGSFLDLIASRAHMVDAGLQTSPTLFCVFRIFLIFWTISRCFFCPTLCCKGFTGTSFSLVGTMSEFARRECKLRLASTPKAFAKSI